MKKTLTEKIYDYIRKSVNGRTSAQIQRFALGRGDSTRLVRFLQNAGLVVSDWRKGKHYKIYKTA